MNEEIEAKVRKLEKRIRGICYEKKEKDKNRSSPVLQKEEDTFFLRLEKDTAKSLTDKCEGVR